MVVWLLESTAEVATSEAVLGCFTACQRVTALCCAKEDDTGMRPLRCS